MMISEYENLPVSQQYDTSVGDIVSTGGSGGGDHDVVVIPSEFAPTNLHSHYDIWSCWFDHHHLHVPVKPKLRSPTNLFIVNLAFADGAYLLCTEALIESMMQHGGHMFYGDLRCMVQAVAVIGFCAQVC